MRAYINTLSKNRQGLQGNLATYRAKMESGNVAKNAENEKRSRIDYNGDGKIG